MALARWKPFTSLMSVNDRINKLFDDRYNENSENNEYVNDQPATWYPSTDVSETKDDFVFKLQVPGLKKEDINIEICENVLSIKGERKVEKEIKKEHYHRVERFSGKFQRSFTLPGEIESSKIKASMKNGVLELKVPKAEKIKARAIPIDIK